MAAMACTDGLEYRSIAIATVRLCIQLGAYGGDLCWFTWAVPASVEMQRIRRGTFHVLDTFELPACSSCKSTTLPQTWRHAHCVFTVAKNSGALQIGQIKKHSGSEVIHNGLNIFGEVSD
jgi:hypothetical protein